LAFQHEVPAERAFAMTRVWRFDSGVVAFRAL
jgi:hypothetical protein